jgi:sporulation protein YlmC with PRC-barrel domain
MVSGKYFNKGVMALDTPHIGHVVRETDDRIVVFGDGKERYDIPITEIQTTGRNVLIGLSFHEIMKRYRVGREAPLPTSKPVNPWTFEKDVDLATFEGKYPRSLFNKGVRAKNEDHVGHVMKETDKEIVVFGDHNFRYDIPKSKIIAVGRNVILDMDFPEIFKYKVEHDVLLPTGEPIETLVNEEENLRTEVIDTSKN